jgi:[acyl-carrier-protein] S-malonyltransferase
VAAKARGARHAKALAVSAPFHCTLMQPAAQRLGRELERVQIAALALPVVTNVEATPNQDPTRVRELLTRQVTAPVRWEESIRCLEGMGVAAVVEIGAGHVLSGLVRRIAPGLGLHSAADLDKIAEVAGIAGASGRGGGGQAHA